MARRYAIELDLRIVVREPGGAVAVGTGSTLDLSSGGVLFRSAAPLAVGAHVELWIRWPASLDRARPLTLIAHGIVVRKHDDIYGLNLVRHEFSACHYQEFREPKSGMPVPVPPSQ